jgi:two-component system, sensor histidine kinase LadS
MLGLLLAVALSGPISIDTAAQALRDPSETLRISDVAGRHGRDFSPSPSLPEVPEGYTPFVTWFRVQLNRGDSTQAWALQFSYKITRVDLYVSGPGGYAARSGGFDLARNDATLAPGLMPLPESALRGTPFYLRVASVVDPRGLKILPLDNYMPIVFERRVIFGLFVGFYLTIAIFNFLMFLSLRDRSLLDYAGVATIAALVFMNSFGTLWQLLPPLTFLQRELSYDALSVAYNIGLAMFTIRFLQLSRDKLGIGVVVAGTVLQFSTVAVDFVSNASLAFYVTLISIMGFYAALAFVGVRAKVAGVAMSGYYTAAIACMIVGYAINMANGVLPVPELTVLAYQAGGIAGSLLLALALARRVQATRAQAQLDGLTGVLNRRAFDDALEGTVRRFNAARSPVGALILDIDEFKAFNDRLGHLEGDDCLVRVARACAACVRNGDVFARYGGEEFAAIVPGAGVAELQDIADRMMQAVAGLGVTISIGGASLLVRISADTRTLLQTADEKLYEAKRSGRNRAIIA